MRRDTRRSAKEFGGLMALERSWTSGLLIVSLGVVVSTAIAARSWVSVRLHRDSWIDATGSAKRRIVSDLIEWQADVTTENMDRTAAFRALRDGTNRTLAYLKKAGIAESEIEVSAVSTTQN